ncbi:anaphase-promoting complex subunit 1-like [Capsicum annuum]|uniref:anaphase-promoting complex subunit 1-like n=1 Tax=Capsicum annuum TaxID=4072 RepID=UPI001FB16192|nr:anaphase-promoting complex subunit 1-like [Capsicum annuum]
MGDTSDTVLCILQWDSLSIYDTSGEVTSVPLPRSITSIWPLPYGLLLQQAPEGSSQAHIQFSSLSPLLSARDTIRSKREVSTQQNYTAVLGLDFTLKGDGSSMSSHLILKDPLEEPQVYIMLSLAPLCIYCFACFVL